MRRFGKPKIKMKFGQMIGRSSIKKFSASQIGRQGKQFRKFGYSSGG